MSDILEEADRYTELLIQEGLAKRTKVPEKTGFCLACEYPTEGTFCSAECREDYEKISRLNTINGKK